jgi:hypothetical protein
MSITNRYDPSDPNHKVTCTRSRCAELERAPHPAGVHLDQRHEFYDGPDTQLGAVSMYVRDSARKIISEAPHLTPEVVDLVTYIDFLKDQATRAGTDRDRGIREANARALDCDDHGRVIKSLEDQVHHSDQSYRRAEAGRIALLGFLHAVDELTDGLTDGTLRPDFTVTEMVAALKAAARKAHAAHGRAWK